MKIEIGKQYRFKATKGRGRPMIGTVKKCRGMFTEMLVGEEMRLVPTKMITSEHTFRPYQTRKRLRIKTFTELGTAIQMMVQESLA